MLSNNNKKKLVVLWNTYGIMIWLIVYFSSTAACIASIVCNYNLLAGTFAIITVSLFLVGRHINN